MSPRVLFAAAAVLALGACPRGTDLADGLCHSSADCPQFTQCDPTGVCRCTSDDACDASEFCNLAGSCQQKLECFTDDDCRSADAPSAICDTRQLQEDPNAPDDQVHAKTAGQCVTLNSSTTQCLIDSHCPFGFYCDSGVCQVGCRDNGDCPLGEPCIDNQCNPTQGACNEPGYCEFGQLCTANDTCQDHADRNTLCEPCKGDDPLQSTCDTCLIDPAVPSTPCSSDSQCSQGYCVHFPCLTSNDCPNGETCSGGGLFTPGECTGHCGDFFCGNGSCDDTTNPCPRGYSCFTLIVVSKNTCTRGGGQCGAGSLCSADAAGELNENGSCSCLSDADCPIGVTCVNPGPNGACVQGSTCGPSSGLQCSDLR